MLTSTPTGHQTNLFGNDLIQQLDPNDPLLQLAQALPWSEFETAFSKHYTEGTGRPSQAYSVNGRIAAAQAVGEPE